ncbi:predicted protein [Heterostelium album PN500]|uniref:Beta-amylase n=1 Tax=Heterostelium pallidum (strain ATCC 26659 / Pp 5 / PN500) TaxID=670386 RepID=D3AW45_HETP5|nr:predicted protein [Heterostelium album PN500]EFA86518.1 predicted protein [Heterostelium album PN500]|eukprot:XP_020438623.1 predicted protein [Heterostelium album PN500]
MAMPIPLTRVRLCFGWPDCLGCQCLQAVRVDTVVDVAIPWQSHDKFVGRDSECCEIVHSLLDAGWCDAGLCHQTGVECGQYRLLGIDWILNIEIDTVKVRVLHERQLFGDPLLLVRLVGELVDGEARSIDETHAMTVRGAEQLWIGIRVEKSDRCQDAPVVGLVALLFSLSIRTLFAFDEPSGVPVYVMLPLDTLSNDNQLNNASTLYQQLVYLKENSQISGVMTDVWWGLVEQQPNQYNWSGYEQLFNLVTKANLNIKVTLSFHQCGGNVGDTCNIPLPPWVLSVGKSNPDIFYTDQSLNRDEEYLSCGIDLEPLFGGRTPVDIYADFMASFKQTFAYLMPETLREIQVGLGPAGEMRYPSYQLAYWTFPGVGEFQCYDKYLLAQLAAAANTSGNPLWGHAGPNNAGTYNSVPSQTGFFYNGFQNYQSTYGQFFLTWYSDTLIAHGDRILSQASSIFAHTNVNLTAKVSGIHWWYGDPSHAAELTAGYKNDQGQAYIDIATMFAKHGVAFDFTCLEMRDSEQPASCLCRPEELVGQTKQAAMQAQISYSGENALQRYDQAAYSEIEYESTRYNFLISGFSYLRLDDYLLSSQAFPLFQSFVSTMSSLQA